MIRWLEAKQIEDGALRKLKWTLEREAQWNRCLAVIPNADIPEDHKLQAMLHNMRKHFGKYYTPEVSIAHTSD